MPKVKYLGTDKTAKRKPLDVPPPDLLNLLFDRYKNANNFTDRDLAEKLNTSVNYVRVRRSKGSDHLSVSHVRQMCEILNITDPAEVGRAILRL